MPSESKAARKARAARIARRLARAYPEARIALEHEGPFQLLVATILSAQCTDERVNAVTPALFARYPTPRALADADPVELEALIRPTGFYRQKAKSLLATARDLDERFAGEVPASLEELVTLRGVARKTANVVLGACFGIPGLAVDTHMRRVNQRLGLVASDDPDAIERDLAELLPPREWTAYTHRVIHHGRACCAARRPRCDACPLREECPWPARSRRATARPRRPRAAGPRA
jgi:endonuclease-3